MKKKKAILTFEVDGQKFWSKETGERRDTDYVCLADLPDLGGVIFASTLGGNMSEKDGKNVHADLQGIMLEKEKKARKSLRIIWKNGKEICLSDEHFVLLFVSPDKDNLNQDNTLIFNFTRLLGEKIYRHCFFSDKETGDAVAIFWLLKEFF